MDSQPRPAGGCVGTETVNDRQQGGSYAVKERAEEDEDLEWLDAEKGLGISVLKTLVARWNQQAVFANKKTPRM